MAKCRAANITRSVSRTDAKRSKTQLACLPRGHKDAEFGEKIYLGAPTVCTIILRPLRPMRPSSDSNSSSFYLHSDRAASTILSAIGVT